MIAVIDYHKGNIRSVVRGLEASGADVVVTDDAADLAHAQAVVLPGVGAFFDAMDALDELSLSPALVKIINDGMPFLGICLGMHALFEGGTEHASLAAPRAGLGVLPGIVDLMPKEADRKKTSLQTPIRFKVPHVGWNTADLVPAAEDDPLFAGIPAGEHFYFTHSYIAPESPFTVAQTVHSVPFPSVVRKGNAWGVQFHPEKSSNAGARLLANFVKMAE